MDLTFKQATSDDLTLLISFIRVLAAHEGRPEVATVTEDGLSGLLFGDNALAEAYLGFADGASAAFLIVAERFSSFLGTRSLYLEDMLVLDKYRGEGLGKQAFAFAANLALSRGYSKLEWSALDDNDVAIGFYDHINAERKNGVLHFSMSKPQMKLLTESVL